MGRKRYNPAAIGGKLRQAEVLHGRDLSMAEAIRQALVCWPELSSKLWKLNVSLVCALAVVAAVECNALLCRSVLPTPRDRMRVHQAPRLRGLHLGVDHIAK